MKKIGIILLLILVGFQISGQEKSKEKLNVKKVVIAEDKKDLKTLESLEKSGSSNEYDRDTLVKDQSFEKNREIVKEKQKDKKKENVKEVVEEKERSRVRNRGERFKGHWAGLEVGFNNYVTSNNTLALPADINYMSLNSGMSYNFNLNFCQLSFGFTRHIGIITGLGINWNNYRFDGNFNIRKNTNGTIDSLSPTAVLKRSKLATLYMTLPVMLEFQIPFDHRHLNVAAGVIGAIKLESHTRMIYENGTDIKKYDDYGLNLLRYGATARIGYQNFHIYGTYYTTPLFQKGKGPGGYDLFPFEIGLAFTFHD
jgi:hypothetical protein